MSLMIHQKMVGDMTNRERDKNGQGNRGEKKKKKKGTLESFNWCLFSSFHLRNLWLQGPGAFVISPHTVWMISCLGTDTSVK